MAKKPAPTVRVKPLSYQPTKDTHPSFVPAKDRPTVEIVDHGYQPSRTELAEDLRFKGSLEKVAKALVQPVNIRRATRPR